MGKKRDVGSMRELIRAGCLDCGKEWHTLNGHGLAVQHHDRTGHWTYVDYEQSIYYRRQERKE